MSNTSLFNNLFSFSKDGSVEKITEKYPWCSLAQLSLLHQYKKNNSELFKEQANKTALFFNNTGWLNWQLYLLSKQEQAEQTVLQENPVDITEVEEHNVEIQKTLSKISSEVDTAEELPAFEPLYTVDYFASQGIKLSEEPAANDKLGNQMKSFTEWLKSMKKIHKEKLAEGDEQTDKNIQQIAEHSNVNEEIVTEAMADVLIKQDKIEKAIAVYTKLSLINPSKSAYFAAKINSLKTS